MAILVSDVALTVAKNRSGSHVYLYKGQGIESAALDPEDAKRLVEAGFLKAKAVAPAPTRSAAGSGQNGTGDSKVPTIPEVLAAVGEDPEKAQAALAAEQARGADARSTLVEKLEAIANPS